MGKQRQPFACALGERAAEAPLPRLQGWTQGAQARVHQYLVQRLPGYSPAARFCAAYTGRLQAWWKHLSTEQGFSGPADAVAAERAAERERAAAAAAAAVPATAAAAASPAAAATAVVAAGMGIEAAGAAQGDNVSSGASSALEGAAAKPEEPR